jgi:hypothetical protein
MIIGSHDPVQEILPGDLCEEAELHIYLKH